jgi:hypothetical protein
MLSVVIDRFEETVAVCERPDRTMINIPLGKLPEGAREGDILLIEGDKIRVDASGTAKRKRNLADRMKRLQKPHQRS